MKFEIISDEIYAVREAGYELDFKNDSTHIDKSLYSYRPDDVADDFYDLDYANLCKGDDGYMYAVMFHHIETDKPHAWQRVVKA